MKLRAQLVIVSLFALFLPWAGCSFIYEMETILRAAQQDALAAVADSLTLLIEERAGTRGDVAAAGDAGQTMYFYTDATIPAVDGYPENEPGSSPRTFRYTEAHRPDKPLQAEALGVIGGADAYLFIRVADPRIRYHNPAGGDIASGDHIVIAMGTSPQTRRYWLAPEAPGEFIARYRRNGEIVNEPRIRGVWRDHQDGYQVELRFPVAMLGDNFGFAAVDGDNPQRWVGNMAPRAAPGALIRNDAELTADLATFAGDNLRLSVVDEHHWVRARAGALQYRAPDETTLPPGGWMLEAFYRWLMSGDEDLPRLGDETDARMERDEVNAALGGRAAMAWYRVEGARGIAVASVSAPIDDGSAVLVAEQSSSRILSLTNGAVVRLLFLTLMATFLISFGLVLYASVLSLRIRRLGRNVAAVLSDDGQVANTFPRHWARDEIGDLGRHFGHLLGRMREYNDYLKSLASKLSHELRTPLAVVSSSLDNMGHISRPGPEQDYIERARDGVERLSRILTAMSEASRVEQSIRSADVERLNLNTLLEKNVAGFREAFGRPIECLLPNEAIFIEGSADLLAQMLDKLMDNADDFCPPGGRIAFVLRQAAANAVLSVENDGPPLPDAMRGELFESMVSIRAGLAGSGRSKPHLGLGLTIVRLVAEFQRGRASAANLPGGNGVRFSIELPSRS